MGGLRLTPASCCASAQEAKLQLNFDDDDDELHYLRPAHTVPLASARQHPENQKENQGMRQSRLPPTQGERREGHDLGSQRLSVPLFPLAAPS